MTYTVTGRLLLPIRASFFAFSSPNFSFSRSRNPFYGKCGQLKTLIKGIEPILQDCASKFQYRLSIQRKCVQSLCFSGGKLIMASMVGLPGWMNLHPHVSYALDEKHHADWGGNLYPLEDDSNNFWALVRKFWLPAFLVMTVMMGLDHPITLAVKIIFFLLSTRPSPLSVYLFVEQLRRQIMRQQPYLYKLKCKAQIKEMISLQPT
ncbi:PREDICTED: uncharacterized protein LOC104593133 isoform X3 [Nelumbo nucifera]|uniref:Uncharacterized protein LOC104593133 isoform X3 n=1 Tax=Nelumbo nucifera TaxID=4432 RepID=A0A1U8Q140_NELNU|nr:PREDICTED: uncharacterized protein LOC104593133 isoform X3 [Nelumbo nucifera]